MSTGPLDLYLVIGITIVFTGAVFALLPRLTRPDVYFAVTVPADFRDSPAGRAIAARFRRWTIATAGAALGVVGAAAAAHRPRLVIVAVVLQILALVPPFLAARRRTRPFAVAPSSLREAALSPHGRRGGIDAVLHAGPFLLVAAAAVVIAIRWASLPDRIPIHWGLTGRADDWAARTPGNVALMLGAMGVLCAVLAVMSWQIGYRVRRVRADGPAAAAETRFRRLLRTALVIGLYVLAMPAVLLGLLAFDVESHTPLIWLVPMLALLALVGIAAWCGQGGARLAAAAGDAQPGKAPVGDRTADDAWKAGLFYFNREDPALFVEKRFGIGYTFNFGNPWSWVLLALLVGVPLALALGLSSTR